MQTSKAPTAHHGANEAVDSASRLAPSETFLIRGCLRVQRTARTLRSRGDIASRVIGHLLSIVYRYVSLHVIGMDIPTSVQIAAGVHVHHGLGLVVHSATVIEHGVTLRQNTTIGGKDDGTAPTLKRGCSIGPNSVVIGAITIGENAVVGAGSVVTKDVAPGQTVAGNPAAPLKRVEP